MWNAYRSVRNLLSVPLLLITSLFLISNCGPSTVQGSSSKPIQHIQPKQCYQQFGVNLSGAEWDDIDFRPTSEELTYYSKKGVKIIRLPMRWDRLQPQLYGSLSVDEVTWLKSYIFQAYKLHMTVDVDIHLRFKLDDLNFGTKLPATALTDLWGKLATTLQGVPGICGYDIANEPNHYRSFFGLWPNQANDVISAIRKVDKTHYIFVPIDNWDPSSQWNVSEAEQIVDSSRLLVFEAHSYWDGDTSGQYNPDSPPENATEAKSLVENSLAPFVQWCATANNRCFLGEFGVPFAGPKDHTWLLALDDALQYLKQNNIGGTYWAGGPGWGSDYSLSIEPANGDRPQMQVLEKYLSA